MNAIKPFSDFVMPTRVSIETDDSGEAAYQLALRRGDVIVLLDGVEQRNCLTADSVEGFVKRYATASGKLLYNSNKSQALTEIVKGKVEIVIRPRETTQ